MALIGQTTLSGLVNQNQPSFFSNGDYPTSFYNPDSLFILVGGWNNVYIGYNYSQNPTAPSLHNWSQYQQFTDINNLFSTQEQFNTADFFNDYYLAIHANMNSSHEIIKIINWDPTTNYTVNPGLNSGMDPSLLFSVLDNPLVQMEVERGVGTTSAGNHLAGDYLELHDTLESAEESILGDLVGYNPSANPVYFEDYDGNNDGELTPLDASNWGQVGRPDISLEIVNFILTGEYPPHTPTIPTDSSPDGVVDDSPPHIPFSYNNSTPLISYIKKIIVNEPKIGDRSQYNFNNGDSTQPSETFYGEEGQEENTEYLATLPFPQYFEEFDINGDSTIEDDTSLWAENPGYRGDISDMLYNLSAGSAPPSYYTYPDYVYGWSSLNDIPSGIEDEESMEFIYENSTSLPENNDKFQNKDLFTNCIGHLVNEAIIEKNLKFEGESFIKIENLYISNTGVDGTTKSNHVEAWIFSEAAYGGDPTQDGYSTIKNKMKDEWKFYSQGFGNKSKGTDIGNITEVEQTPIVSNFSSDSTNPEVGVIDGITMTVDDLPDTFKLSAFNEVDLLTSLFNQRESNPIYIVVWMRGHKKVFWPINTDERKRRYDVFKISNTDLFDNVGIIDIGKVHQINFTTATTSRTGEGGGGAQQAAWKVTSLILTINTSAGIKNIFGGSSNYKDAISEVLPAISINENSFEDYRWVGYLNPRLQLDNIAHSADADVPLRHPDFIPITTFGFSQNNQLGNNYVDLQSYHNDFNSIMRASSPLDVTFKIDLVNPDGDNLPPAGVDGSYGDRKFYYFVIDWDDIDDKFKTIDDWLESRPENNFDYLELQNQNLYKLRFVYGTSNLDLNSTLPKLNNVYTTPGIKNVKFIMFSVWDGKLSSDDLQIDISPEFEVGRWKLCTSRIYLDIPPNQYPDFSEVGGNNYTTIPWPFTTPIIGGISSDSRYKKSIRDTLGGGKVGDFDIIDERFLVNDLENDEMGKSINYMDLEQCRYFNTSYGINELLNIPIEYEPEVDYLSQPSENFYNPTTTLADDENTNTDPDYLATLPFPQYIEEFDLNGNSEVDFEDAGEWGNYGSIGRPDISDFLYNLLSDQHDANVNQDYYTYPDYVYDWDNISDIQSGIVTTPVFPLYTDFNYWDGETNKFPMESSVGQIFITENQDLDLKQSCKLELNTGKLTGKSILDTSGNSNKGLLIGDYKVKKVKKGQSMRRDSFIKVPKKTGNKDGAL